MLVMAFFGVKDVVPNYRGTVVDLYSTVSVY